LEPQPPTQAPPLPNQLHQQKNITINQWTHLHSNNPTRQQHQPRTLQLHHDAQSSNFFDEQAFKADLRVPSNQLDL
jgi:hypothetical protein